MAHQVLYRAYRPSTFEEVIGQEYIVKTLQNSIKKNNIAHAYLFCGPRGTGKTTIAKIFAKAINCVNKEDDACDKCESCISANEGRNPDIFELDAASNNSVENIRDLIKNISYAPINGKYKVYIIDEVHMLSSNAFNAFLKTLEEPPAHVVFILATTEPNKILPTVLSRCQRYNFSKLRPFEIKERMIEVLKNEKVKYEEDALDIIATLAEGGMRDALSLLEQYLSYNHELVNIDDVRKLFSLSETKTKIELIKNTHNGNIAEAISTLRQMYQQGVDVNRLTIELLNIIKETLIYSDSMNDSLLESISKLQANELIQNIEVKHLYKDIDCLEEVLSKTKGNQNMLSYLELALIKMSNTNQIEAPIKQETIQPIKKQTKPKEPVKEVVEETKEENVSEIEESKDLNDLLNILKQCTRDHKINDEIIINKIEMYRYDENYRKFFMILSETKLFTSSEDAILLEATPSIVHQINDPIINEQLFNFINEEYKINKMVFGVTSEEVNKLVELYKKLTPEEKTNFSKIEKYKAKKSSSKEEKLKAMFDDLKVEE